MAIERYTADGQTWRRLLNMLRWFETTHEREWFGQPQPAPPLAALFDFRWGKLDGALAVSGTATVSLWWNDTTNSWYEDVNAANGEDSGQNWEDCYGPPVQSSEIDSGTWVGVLQLLGGVKVVVIAGCPT